MFDWVRFSRLERLQRDVAQYKRRIADLNNKVKLGPDSADTNGQYTQAKNESDLTYAKADQVRAERKITALSERVWKNIVKKIAKKYPDPNDRSKPRALNVHERSALLDKMRAKYGAHSWIMEKFITTVYAPQQQADEAPEVSRGIFAETYKRSVRDSYADIGIEQYQDNVQQDPEQARQALIAGMAKDFRSAQSSARFRPGKVRALKAVFRVAQSELVQQGYAAEAKTMLWQAAREAGGVAPAVVMRFLGRQQIVRDKSQQQPELAKKVPPEVARAIVSKVLDGERSTAAIVAEVLSEHNLSTAEKVQGVSSFANGIASQGAFLRAIPERYEGQAGVDKKIVKELEKRGIKGNTARMVTSCVMQKMQEIRHQPPSASL